MSTLALWKSLRLRWQPDALASPLPEDERVITDAGRLHRSLEELAQLARPVSVQSADGQWTCHGALAVGKGKLEILVGSNPPRGGTRATVSWPLNATACGPRGMVMFSLATGVVQTHESSCRLHAAWPDRLIHEQSRRHFRLASLARPGQDAWLGWPGSAQRVPLLDLSEAGVGFESGSVDWPESRQVMPAALHLGDATIPVPRLEVVHVRPGAAGRACHVGARLVHMHEEHIRWLRRWINAMHSTQCRALDTAS